MFPRLALLSLMLATVAWATEPTSAGPTVVRSNVTSSKLVAASVISATDHVGSGWCGRGVYSILKKLGLGEGLEGGNGQDWEKILQEAGWKPVRCMAPQQAPLGSVLVYLGDSRIGKRHRGTRGGYFGHVEIVALGREGQRLYVADSPRVKPGGTVRDNFTGRAWMPPGSVRSTPPPVEQQVASIYRERQQMAQDYFASKRQQFTQLRTGSLTVDASFLH